MGETILVLGGMRSGKSRLAERLASERAPVTYVATSTVDPSDPEMAQRIEHHRARRPADWTTVEEPRELERTLANLVGLGGSVVVDCLTLWISNLMLGLAGSAVDDAAILEAVDRAAAASRGEARVIWVSNEVGSGVVPENPLARRFADLQGWANQRAAAAFDVVYLCVAGLPVRLK